MKGVGKTTIGFFLAQKINKAFIDLDRLIEEKYTEHNGEKASCREIFEKEGREYFRDLESEVLSSLSDISNTVFATGGGTPLEKQNQEALKGMGTIVFLDEEFSILSERILRRGVPAYIKNKDNAKEELQKRYDTRTKVYQNIADHHIVCEGRNPNEVVNEIIKTVNI